MSLSFEDLVKLQKGDRVEEQDMGMADTFELLEDASVKTSMIGGETHRQVLFKARRIKGGEIVDHKVTEGLMHYAGDYYRCE